MRVIHNKVNIVRFVIHNMNKKCVCEQCGEEFDQYEANNDFCCYSCNENPDKNNPFAEHARLYESW